ncbi:MAG TPA: PadR family transcriptional regulator [Acidimicrobiales bacterium]
MAPRGRSNPLALAVLCTLSERPMHPYEISQTLRARAKHESIRLNFGSLYGVVAGLERRGLIHAVETVREGKRPERTVYEITDAGRREMYDWLSELIAAPAKEYLQFEAGLSLMGVLPPDEAVALLRQRCNALEIQLEQDEAVREAMAKRGLPRLFVIEGEYTTALAKAELEFVRLLIADIESGQLEGIDQWRSWHEGDPTWSWDDAGEAVGAPRGFGARAARAPGADDDPDDRHDGDGDRDGRGDRGDTP